MRWQYQAARHRLAWAAILTLLILAGTLAPAGSLPSALLLLCSSAPLPRRICHRRMDGVPGSHAGPALGLYIRFAQHKPAGPPPQRLLDHPAH